MTAGNSFLKYFSHLPTTSFGTRSVVKEYVYITMYINYFYANK